MEQGNLINIYNDKIRRSFDQKSGKWYFSIVDVISVATDSADARNYWKVFKNRLNKTQNQLVTSYNQLKMESSDGKFYLTDTGDGDAIVATLAMISPLSIPHFQAYLSTLTAPKSTNITSLLHPKFETEKSYFEPVKIQPESYPQTEGKSSINIDMYREKNIIVIKFFIGGVSLIDLEIVATSQKVYIQGSRTLLNKVDINNYTRQEISWGEFMRIVNLPYEININKTEAIENRNIITITMPMIDKSYTRRIKIKSL